MSVAAPAQLSISAATSDADSATRKVHAERLATELRLAIEGEVRFDSEAKSLYAQDASNYRQIPIGVVIPKTIEEVIKTVEICRKHNAPVMGRGAGTSLAGQCCNVAVVIDFSKYLNKVIEFNPEQGYAWVQPGIILDDLRNLAETKHLTFGPDPATHDRCTMGGMIGNNSCGVHSVMAGRTADNIEALDILLYDGTRFTVGPTTEDELARIIADGGRRGEIYAQLKTLRDRYAEEIRARFPILPRRVSGFNLEELLEENGFNVARALVGTEGTCITILGAKVKLVHSPAVRALVVLGYTSVYFAADHVKEILKHKPVGLEGMDDYLLNFLRRKQEEREKGMHTRPSSNQNQDIRNSGFGIRSSSTNPSPVVNKKDAGDILPPGTGWLLVEFGGESLEEAQAKCQNLMMELGSSPNAPSMKLMRDPQEEKMVWEVRKSGLGATAFLPGNNNTWPGWEDAAVPPVHLGEYLREFDKLRKKYQYECAMYGHFGDGCIHMRIDFDLVTKEGVEKYLRFMEEAADLVAKYKGSLSGEHGDGQTRAHLLPKMFGDELVHAFRLFKGIWDPTNRMNPGKVVDPYAPDSNLRLGPGYKSWRGETVFSYAESDHSFGRALLRCVGVGKCRRIEGGTMCPSFMVTREEKHSTRGRAHLLADMLTGDVIQDGWKSEEVKESLDLCLACKGCKADCPVNVDMATYKAEFLYRYYQGRLRPMGSYAMGLIYWWARLSSFAPGLVNFFTQNPAISKLMKAAAGIAQQRPMPKFARQHFKKWYARNHARSTPQSALPTPHSNGSNHIRKPEFERNPRAQRVILWSDTFNNYFTPDTSRAALEVLEAAGFEVIVPPQALCCGRPLYDHGFLGLAKKLLREIMTTLRTEIEAGIPIVGLEPSCVAVFRDEVVNLFENEPLAYQLAAQTFTLAEFLDKYAPDWQPPAMEGRAVYHGHCHQKSVLTTGSDVALLKKMGLAVETPDTGCCGMAGAFGFDAHNYDISVAIGERVLLPAARTAAADTLIVTDGFSCREQIEQLTDRKPLHLAQVLQRAINTATTTAAGESQRPSKIVNQTAT